MTKLFTRASVSGASLSGANLKATLTALWDALGSVGVTDSNRTTVTASATLLTTQCGWLPVDCTAGSIVLTLPASGTASDECEFRIRRVDSSGNTLTVQRNGADTIEGSASSIVLNVLQQVDFKLPAGTTNWRVTGRGGGSTTAARAALGVGTTGNTLFIAGTATDALAAIPIQAGTAVTASGTSIDFTSIPSWVKRVTINVAGLSTNGTSNPLFQIGDSGGIETSGYLGSGSTTTGAVTSSVLFTTGFGLNLGAASIVFHGSIVLTLLDSATNTWVATGTFGRSDVASNQSVGGSKALSGTLDRIRITTVSGADSFDAGLVNILYE